jgi:hypothetical protein
MCNTMQLVHKHGVEDAWAMVAMAGELRVQSTWIFR